VLLRLHFDVILREAAESVIFEKGAVAAVEDIKLRIGEAGVSFGINRAVFVANIFGHDRCPMSRILTMKDEKGFWGGLNFKQLRGQLFFVVEVDGPVDVSTVVFILEATVNDEELLVMLVEVAVEDADEGLFGDSRKIARSVIGDEVRKPRNMFRLYIHDRGQRWSVQGRLLVLHDVFRMFEHAE
jgi:hypothetical protein